MMPQTFEIGRTYFHRWRGLCRYTKECAKRQSKNPYAPDSVYLLLLSENKIYEFTRIFIDK